MHAKSLLAALAPLAVSLLGACSAKEAPVPAVPQGAQAGDLVDLQPCTYEAGEIAYAADCGTLVVPENRSDPVALDYERIDLLGESYGSRVEMIYAWRYPNSMQRVVMGAANPPWNPSNPQAPRYRCPARRRSTCGWPPQTAMPAAWRCCG